MNGEKMIFEVTPEESGTRIDRFLADRLLDQTRSFIQKSIENHAVLIGNQPCNKSDKVKTGDVVSIEIPEPVEDKALPENIPLHIIYEDDDLLVVNKAKGMVVHPAPGNPSGTLVNALLYHCKGNLSGINGVIRPGIVHRIDKDTSGLLIVAKNDKAHQHLAAQIAEHSFTREYEAVVYGKLKEQRGTVNAPIGRSKNDRKKMAVTFENSRDAVTHYEVIEEKQGFTHIRCRLETGRTHQIRVHMASLGHPVAGDPVYGPKKVIEKLGGQCLHAKKIGFIHPSTGAYLEFDSELPAYFKSFLAGIPQK
ncbi:MAG: RluA family pseudouridine synthase [Oscillospiraceae bacterium]|nr:RluA family pseudouridine synthase [Oscillospiraceae bacterium]